MKNAGRTRLAFLLSLVYALFLVWAASHHVIWRDEARAFSIAVTPSSLGGLFSSLRDEGHPALWYLLLRAAHGLVHSSAVLKAVTLLSALAGICIFAFCAPYSLWEILLWTLGLLSLHEYSVLCRPYCLLPPLLFGLCALYPSRRKHPWAAGLLLLLLANANAYGCVLVVAFLMGDGLKLALESSERRALKPFAIQSGLALVGLVGAVLVMLPDRGSLLAPPFLYHSLPLAGQVALAVRSQGGFAGSFFALPWALPVGLVTVLWYLFMGRRLHLSLFVFTAVLGCELMSRLVYPAGLYHQGVLLLVLVAAHWMATNEAASGNQGYAQPLLERGFTLLARTVLLLLLLIQVRLGLAAAYDDARVPASSSRALADTVLAHPELKDAVLMAEPDYQAEALPYYLNQSIFIPREGRFGPWTSFTIRNQARFTLAGLLEAAREVHAREHVPVLMVLGFDLNRPGIYRFSFGKAFAFDPAQVADWKRNTRALASFGGASTDENYTLYELKP